jgi:hypothetical protein
MAGSGALVVKGVIYYFSFLTPLNGLLLAFWSMNFQVSASRFVHLWVLGLNVCERFLTAPLLWLSPYGLFLAI